jgi:hypothetical protein
MKDIDSSLSESLPFSHNTVQSRQALSSNPVSAWLPTVYRWLRNGNDDDDDDPPPCPAIISPTPRLPPFGVGMELEAA